MMFAFHDWCSFFDIFVSWQRRIDICVFMHASLCEDFNNVCTRFSKTNDVWVAKSEHYMLATEDNVCVILNFEYVLKKELYISS